MAGQQRPAARRVQRRAEPRAQPGGGALNWLDAQSIIDAAGDAVVIVVTLIIFVETAFLATSFLPGDSLLFITGLTVATLPSVIPPWLAFALVLAAAIGGTQVGYEIGRAVGPPLLRRRRWPLTDTVVARTTAVFERLGARAIIIGRFIPILRALVPVLAGITGMPRRRFVVLNLIGAVAWIGVFMLGGFLLGQVPLVKENLELAVIIVIVLSSLPLPFELWRDARRRRAEAERSSAHDDGHAPTAR